MSYVLRYEKRVLKDLDLIPKKDLIRIGKTIQALALQPHPVGVKKLVGEENLYRARQGDYRTSTQWILRPGLLAYWVSDIAGMFIADPNGSLFSACPSRTGKGEDGISHRAFS